MESKNVRKIILMLIILSTVVVAGCVGQQQPAGAATTIKSQEQASQVITNISVTVGDVTSKLEEIDRGLG